MKWKTASYGLGLMSCFALSPHAYAGTMGEKPTYPDGWAFIAGAGETGFMNVGTYTLSANGLSKTPRTRSFQFGFMGDLAVGYGKRISHPFYLGSEAGVIFFGTRKTASQTTAGGTTVIQDSPVFGEDKTVTVTRALESTVTASGNVIVPYIDLKPGLLISDSSILFGRIGVDYNQLKVRTASNYRGSGQSIPAAGPSLVSGSSSASFASTHKAQRAGLRTGLGFEYLLTENIGISANYIYAFYSTLVTATNGTMNQVTCDASEGCPVNSDGTYSATGRSKMSDQQVLLELNYHLT
jgi:opacity protein-like surface antigen